MNNPKEGKPEGRKKQEIPNGRKKEEKTKKGGTTKKPHGFGKGGRNQRVSGITPKRVDNQKEGEIPKVESRKGSNPKGREGEKSESGEKNKRGEKP